MCAPFSALLRTTENLSRISLAYRNHFRNRPRRAFVFLAGLRALQASPRRDGHSGLPPARPNFYSGHRCVGCRGGRDTLHHGERSTAPHRLFLARDEFCTTKLLSDSAGAACGNRRPQHFRHYLVGATVILRTDHHSLKWLRTFKRSERILAWIETLAEFYYTVQHRPGRLHSNADGLSRPFCKQ